MALLSIHSARLNEKPTWGQVIRRSLTKVFALEGLDDKFYGEFHATGQATISVRNTTTTTSGAQKTLSIDKNPVWIFAIRKLLNPLKVFIEFPLTLLHDIADRICQIGADEPEESNIGEREIKPEYGFFRTFLRLIVQTSLGLPLILVRHITSPVNTLIRPLVQYAQHHPWKFLGFVLLPSLLITLFVGWAILTAGLTVSLGMSTVPIAGKLAMMIGSTSSLLATSAIAASNLSWIGTAINIALIASTAVLSLSFTRQLASSLKYYLRDIYHEGGEKIFTHKEYHVEGFEYYWRNNLKTDARSARDQACDIYDSMTEKSTTYSRLHFSTPANNSDGTPFPGTEPSHETLLDSFGSFIGIFHTLDGPSRKEIEATKVSKTDESYAQLIL